MDITKRLLEAVKGGETAVSFSGAVSVSLEDGVFKVGDWEGSEAEDAAAKVVEAMIAEGPVQEEPGDVVILAKNVSLPDLVWVTKPYDKLADAPENIRELDGAKLTLAQVNWIANMADGLKGKKDIESPWAVAKAQFKKAFKKEGDKWVKPKEEEGKKKKERGKGQGAGGPKQGDAGTDTCVCPECDYEVEHERGTPCSEMGCPKCEGVALRGKESSLNQVQDAFYNTFNPREGEKAAGPSVWTKEVFPAAVVAEDAGQLYRVPYTTEGDVIKFADRADWEKGKMVWEAEEASTIAKDVPKFWRSKEARMLLAVTKAWLQKKESEAVVWKEGDRRFYLGLVSLAIKDKEGELVTMEGADFSIDLARRYKYHSGLYIKHVVPESLVGRSIRERRIGPFWVEYGEFKNTPLANWAYRVLENDEEGKWRFSIGFVTPKTQAVAGRYTRLLKFDSTLTEKPAQPLTAMLKIMEGGTNSMESQSIEKLMTFLNPETDEEKKQVTKMLADIFVEDKEMVAVAKDVGAVMAAIVGLEDEELKKKLLAALPGGAPKEKKKEMEEVADVVAAAVTTALESVLKRLDAVEASAGAAALAELRAALITRSRDLPKPSDTAVPVEDGAAIIEKIEKLLDPSAGRGAHPLSAFAHGPTSTEGG